MRYSSCSLLCFETVSGRSHKETWAGCIVSRTTPTRFSLKASRSVSALSLEEKASRVFLASYFLRRRIGRLKLSAKLTQASDPTIPSCRLPTCLRTRYAYYLGGSECVETHTHRKGLSIG